MTKLVVFDVDGTILDSWGGFERVVMKYSADTGLPPPDFNEIKLGYSHPHHHDFGWGVDKDTQRYHLIQTFKIYEGHEVSGAHTPSLFDGVEEALEHLKDLGHTLAIITSKSEAPLLRLLDHYNIGRLFSTHRAFDDIHRRSEKEKPAPDMLHSVMKELQFAPEETVMIGDTTMDIKMGRNADTHTIGVTWGSHPKQHLVDAGAHHIVETEFNDVAHTVKKIFG